MRHVERLLAPLPKVYLTQADQERAVSTFKELRLKNNIGAVDVRIAELAKGQGATLCSLNEKHFRVVPGLKLEIPYRR